ncbi:MAG: hypothetical protein H6624_04035 [Bdellovibrionaceae bacterium]|nr:hypothetical protein [Bdellovibrionales bacterium]MCB9083484.1 hypothetical protein [Pseudobdellovibrionaceae bacterium]
MCGQILRWLLGSAVVLVLSQCSGENRDSEDPPVAPLGRTLLASTPIQASERNPNLLFNFEVDDSLAADVDVVSLHEDFFGVPWEAFSQSKTAPDYFAVLIQELKQRVNRWDRPLYLSLAISHNENRRYLAEHLFEDDEGKLVRQARWTDPCFNFDTHPDGEKWRRAYLNYSEYMIRTFKPRYLTNGIEVTMFQNSCRSFDPGAFPALIKVLNQVYDLAKEIDPQIVVFPSLQVGYMMDIRPGGVCYRDTGLDLEVAKTCMRFAWEEMASLKMDRVGLSIYPHVVGGIPDNSAYLAAALDVVKDRQLVIAETGHPSSSLLVNGGPAGEAQCLTAVEHSDDQQVEWLKAVLQAAKDHNMELVTWWSARDVFPEDFIGSCPCEDSRSFCETAEIFRLQGGDFTQRVQNDAILRAFQSMGYRTYDGLPKESLGIWRDFRK